MIDILTKITRGKSGISRANAQNYTNDILEAISKVKAFQRIVNKEYPVRKQHTDDTVIKTSIIELSGENVVLTMAFSADRIEPYAAEITKESSND